MVWYMVGGVGVYHSVGLMWFVGVGVYTSVGLLHCGVYTSVG